MLQRGTLRNYPLLRAGLFKPDLLSPTNFTGKLLPASINILFFQSDIDARGLRSKYSPFNFYSIIPDMHFVCSHAWSSPQYAIF